MERDGYKDVRMSAFCASAPSGDCQKIAIGSLCWVTQGKGQGKKWGGYFSAQETKPQTTPSSLHLRISSKIWGACGMAVVG